MKQLIRRPVERTNASAALALLAEWTPTDRFTSSLHPGDVGWFLRFDEQECAGALEVWTYGDAPVAVSLLDGTLLRIAQPEAAQADQAISGAMATEVTRWATGRKAWCDPPLGSVLRPALIESGWCIEDDPWPHLIFSDREIPAWPAGAAFVLEADAEDRVLVQRQAFERSTFTVQRWYQMRTSPAGDRSVDVLVRTPTGAPAAAATGWLAGPGRCALLEPVGSHPDHRGHGYGRAAVLAATAALLERGASAVGVLTPATNAAAVALYRSAGYRPVAVQCSMIFDGDGLPAIAAPA